MPTYEFKCRACAEQFEVFQSMSAPDPEACERCGAVGQLEKVLFPVAVHYKGSGFYSTDYSGSKSSGAAGEGSGSTSSGSSDGGGSGAGSGSSSSSDASSTSSGSAASGSSSSD